MNKLVAAILNKEKSVRETIDEFASVKKLEEGPLSDLADAIEADADNSAETTADSQTTDQNQEAELVANDDDFPVKMLFVRRFHVGDEKPYKRVKCTSLAEALKVFFEFATKYKNDTVEIWTSTANDAKNFYRFVLKNREQIEPLWKSNLRKRS